MNDALSYSVEAFNTATASENKIHDDAVAARFGFTGGLVPGVEVFAYASHVPLAHFGPQWLERGRMAMRFAKPVYDGRQVTVSGARDGQALQLAVASEGISCASGDAALATPTDIAEHLPQRREPPQRDARPPADDASLAVGTLLSSHAKLIDADALLAYLAAVRETAPLYAREEIIHPGLLLRTANNALLDNVVLPPWIHVGSDMTLHAIGRVGSTIEARAEVVANYERKGHRLVDLRVGILGDGKRRLADVMHTAIYRLRVS